MVGPIRVARLDSDGLPTGEVTEVNAFDFSFTATPTDTPTYRASDLKTVTFTMDLCWAPGGKRAFLEAVGVWKEFEKARKRDAWRARKVKRRQR